MKIVRRKRNISDEAISKNDALEDLTLPMFKILELGTQY